MPTPAAAEIDLELAGEGIARWFEDVKDPRDRSPEEEPVLRLADASEVGVGADEELVHWANEVLGGDSAGEVGVFRTILHLTAEDDWLKPLIHVVNAGQQASLVPGASSATKPLLLAQIFTPCATKSTYSTERNLERCNQTLCPDNSSPYPHNISLDLRFLGIEEILCSYFRVRLVIFSEN